MEAYGEMIGGAEIVGINLHGPSKRFFCVVYLSILQKHIPLQIERRKIGGGSLQSHSDMSHRLLPDLLNLIFPNRFTLIVPGTGEENQTLQLLLALKWSFQIDVFQDF